MGAVGQDIISATVGYALKYKNRSKSSPNLPQRVAVLCEANNANQADLNTEEWEATSLQAVGARYGYGSPAYIIARVALPGLGGIPLVFYPQEEAVGATAKAYSVTPIGTATANATHTIVLSGRRGIDAQFLSFTVNVGDGPAEISAKISDVVSKVIGSNFDPAATEYECNLTSKWKGLTANDLKVRIDTNEKDAGITYTVASEQDGAGTPDIAAALALMEPKWNTIIVNSYSTQTDVCDALEAWNGIPDDDTPTGQYQGTKMKPAIALTGSVDEDPSDFTDARKAEVTIVICAAPNSEGLPMEAAANAAVLQAKTQQDTPELDIIYQNYPDMPGPSDGDIGAMADHEERDRIVKKGCSTVQYVNGKYQIVDFVTTFHPDGELIPAYRYARDLSVAFQIRFTYLNLEKQFVKGKVIVEDDATVYKDKQVVSPSSWKAALYDMHDDLIGRALCVDPENFKEQLSVEISGTNKDRLDTSMETTLTGIARISATENTISFKFGSN